MRDYDDSVSNVHYPTTVELTSRQSEILYLIAKGYSNKQIGRNLGIGVDSVKTHAVNIRRKLGAHNRAHVVAIAYMRGILGAAPQSHTQQTIVAGYTIISENGKTPITETRQLHKTIGQAQTALQRLRSKDIREHRAHPQRRICVLLSLQ